MATVTIHEANASIANLVKADDDTTLTFDLNGGAGFLEVSGLPENSPVGFTMNITNRLGGDITGVHIELLRLFDPFFDPASLPDNNEDYVPDGYVHSDNDGLGFNDGGGSPPAATAFSVATIGTEPGRDIWTFSGGSVADDGSFVLTAQMLDVTEGFNQPFLFYIATTAAADEPEPDAESEPPAAPAAETQSYARFGCSPEPKVAPSCHDRAPVFWGALDQGATDFQLLDNVALQGSATGKYEIGAAGQFPVVAFPLSFGSREYVIVSNLPIVGNITEVSVESLIIGDVEYGPATYQVHRLPESLTASPITVHVP